MTITQPILDLLKYEISMKATLYQIHNVMNKDPDRSSFVRENPSIMLVRQSVDNSSKPKMNKTMMEARIRVMNKIISYQAPTSTTTSLATTSKNKDKNPERVVTVKKQVIECFQLSGTQHTKGVNL